MVLADSYSEIKQQAENDDEERYANHIRMPNETIVANKSQKFIN
jgi:hypothetical protein